MAHVVNTVVGLPRHVAIVKGLNRNLRITVSITAPVSFGGSNTYSAATTVPLHLFSFLGDVKSAADPASPDSAILIKAFAPSKSTAM